MINGFISNKNKNIRMVYISDKYIVSEYIIYQNKEYKKDSLI